MESPSFAVFGQRLKADAFRQVRGCLATNLSTFRNSMMRIASTNSTPETRKTYSALDVLLLRHRENTNPCALRFLQEAEVCLSGLTVRK